MVSSPHAPRRSRRGARLALATAATTAVLCVSACSTGGGGSPSAPSGAPASSAPVQGSAALQLVPVVWRVRDAAGESPQTWIRFDTQIDLIRPKGDAYLSWSMQGDAFLAHVEGWSMTLGSRPPAVPWLTSTTRFSRDGDGWVLLDADGRRTARLVRDGAPPSSDRTQRDAPEVDSVLRAQHADAVPGAAVHRLDPSSVIGTWGLPGVAVGDGSVAFGTDGSWTARTSCRVLGVAQGGAGAYRLLPNGSLLATESAVAGTGCFPPARTPPVDARAVLDFGGAGSLAVDGSRMTVYDREGRSLGTLQRKG